MTDSQIEEPLLDKERKNPPLDEKQINYARELIAQRHKLKKTPWRVTWPFIKFFCCCCLPKRKPSFDLALKRAIRRKLEVTVPKSDQRIADNPFLLIGYGMNSYLQIMVELMIMVGLISLVTIPLMMTLSSFGALEQFPGYDFNQYTLGNIGGSNVFCAQSAFTTAASAMLIECPKGT